MMCSMSVVGGSQSKQFRRHFARPDIKTIFPFKKSPFESDPRVSQWVRQVFELSLMSDKHYKKVGVVSTLTSYCYPHCKDIGRYERICKTMLLFFVIDDHTECEWGELDRDRVKVNQVWNQMYAVADKIINKNTFISMDGWKPYVVKLFEVLNGIYEQMSSVSGKGLLEHYKGYAKASIIESELIVSKYKYKDLEDLLKIRRQSIAGHFVFALIEYSQNLSLTNEEWNHPLLQRLLLLAIDITTYHSDIYSFEKEWLEQKQQYERMINVVALTVTLEGISPEMALVKIAKEVLPMEEKAIDLITVLNQQDISGDMRIFLECTQYIIGGNFHFGDESDRYNKLNE